MCLDNWSHMESDKGNGWRRWEERKDLGEVVQLFVDEIVEEKWVDWELWKKEFLA